MISEWSYDTKYWINIFKKFSFSQEYYILIYIKLENSYFKFE